MFPLRRDPFERADESSNTYWDWLLSHAYIMYAMQAVVSKQIESFAAFPPRQKPASFNLDAVLRKLQQAKQRQSLTAANAGGDAKQSGDRYP
jgi:hypothetical protein